VVYGPRPTPEAACYASREHCRRGVAHCGSTNYVNVIGAVKQVHLQYLDIDAASRTARRRRHLGVASNDRGASPTWSWPVCGELPTMESLHQLLCFASTCSDVKVRL